MWYGSKVTITHAFDITYNKTGEKFGKSGWMKILPEKVKQMNKSMKRLLIITTTTVDASPNLLQTSPGQTSCCTV